MFYLHTEERTEEIVFTENYVKLTGVLNAVTLMPHFIAKRIITIDDASNIKSCDRESEKISNLLEHVARHLKAGHTDSFYQLLDIMKTHGTSSAEELATDMELSAVKLSKGMYIIMVLLLCVFCPEYYSMYLRIAALICFMFSLCIFLALTVCSR